MIQNAEANLRNGLTKGFCENMDSSPGAGATYHSFR